MISRGLKVNEFAQIRLIVEAKFGDNPLAFWIRIMLAIISKARMCFLDLNSAVAKVKTNKRVCY